SATANSSWSRATAAGGNSSTYFLSAGVSNESGRTATYPVSTHHWAARSGEVHHWMNLNAASCSALLALLEMWKLPPPVGLPRRLPAGSMATPNGNFALLRTLVRLPVVVHIMAHLRSKKSFGVVPHSTIPGGWTLCSRERLTQYSKASMTSGLSK